MLLDKQTQNIQSKLANYCRSGNYKPIKGVNEKNVTHYRRLVYNIVNNALSQAYPLLKSHLNEAQWETLVNDFFENHDCQETRIWLMPKEFCSFISEAQYSEEWNLPFLADLLLFEWIEIEVHTMADIPLPKKQEGKIIIDPEHRLVHLNFPIHQKNTKEITSEDEGNFFVLIYRERHDSSVQFLNLSPILAHTFEQLKEGLSIAEISQEISQSIPHISIVEIRQQLENFVDLLRSKKVIL